MIRHLSVRNLALVERLDLTFAPGLNLLTGETGSGKSIIVDSLGLALGERSNADQVRTGMDTGLVDVTFAVDDRALQDALASLGHAPDEGLLTLSREVSRTGRGTCRIQGRVVTTAVLREVGDLLVDVHGQREHQSLLQQERLLAALDSYGGHRELSRATADAHQEWSSLRSEVAGLRSTAQRDDRDLELLAHEVHEIESIAPTLGEDDALAEERSALLNADRLRAAAMALVTALDGSDGGGPPGALELLARAEQDMSRVADHDQRLQAVVDLLQPATAELLEVRRASLDYAMEIRADPARLEQIEGRLDALDRLKRKHGGTLAVVLAAAETAAERLRASATWNQMLAAREADLERSAAALGTVARQLSTARAAAAQRLSRAVEAELSELNMARARLAVVTSWEPAAEGLQIGTATYSCRASGLDRVAVTLAANAGEAALPLQSVGSGGEVSRVMLALRTVLAHADRIPTVILDEVDVGIGGQTAVRLGRKLKSIAADRQVICVTHLASIAALADHHLCVRKDERGGRTVVSVDELEGEDDRLSELARLIAGDAGGAAAVATARELLQGAREGVGR